ncbi:hypothetical protein [Mucilaginibacter myungsuensis]|uniref:Outer membrane protein with beta-barrel domain n=1 Tax=Mucilaginibacter myungsuensis TaxID=649104 RepID=A0A929L0Z0_9SPHI|nr:hypothetical protein [Mucilaginibacter myungsuensis]MBE9662115.1 hypothetical protein [Mucilaginibacter myungsuensis]MDN3599451.1 hypothetical protein [Mucilaginibacter myungsuensis]
MKRDIDKQLDDLFKNSLAEPQHKVPHREEEWDALAQRLDGASGNKKIIALWWPISTAAVLLVAVGLWVLMPKAIKQKQQPQTAVIKKNLIEDTNDQKESPAQAALPVDVSNSKPQRLAANNINVAPRTLDRTAVNRQGALPSQPTQVTNLLPNDAAATDQPPASDNGQAPVGTTVTEQPVIAANTLPANNTAVAATTIVGADSMNNNIAATRDIAQVTAEQNKASIKTSASSFRPQFALSFMGAPEVNGLGAMLNVESGLNVGLLFSASVNRFKLSTGAAYSIKRYGSSYDPWGYMAVARGYSQANVRSGIIDIPLNLDYQLYSHAQNKFSVGAGISSYIMTSQNYQYSYIDPDFNPTEMSIGTTDRYFASTMNLQVTYTRQLTPKFGLSFQPYFKLPLKQIGDSQSKLQTAGLAIGVNWNLNTLRKK